MRSPRSIFWFSVSLAVVGLLAAYRGVVHNKMVSAAGYHQHVHDIAASIPLWTPDGRWMSQDVQLMAGAVTLLHPNVAISRQYTNMTDGRQVGLLVIQCSDARDILGHYPPVCYVGHGWVSLDQKRKEWMVGDMEIHGMEYEYSRLEHEREHEQMKHVIVYDFMLTPDGRTCRDMDELEREVSGYQVRYFGAAQVQLQFDAQIPEAERDRIFQAIVGTQGTLLAAIGSGVKHEG
jgi:hypothetical protein